MAAQAGAEVRSSADVRDPAALAAAVAEAERRWGGLDAAIAAAGVIAGGVPLGRCRRSRSDAVLDVNLGGVLNLARAAVPALLRRPEPRSGASSRSPRPRPPGGCRCWPPTARRRRAWRAWCARWAPSWAAPASPPTPSAPARPTPPILDESARLYGLPAAGDFAGQQPLGRLLEPAEIAAVLAFLAGQRAAR